METIADLSLYIDSNIKFSLFFKFMLILSFFEVAFILGCNIIIWSAYLIKVVFSILFRKEIYNQTPPSISLAPLAYKFLSKVASGSMDILRRYELHKNQEKTEEPLREHLKDIKKSNLEAEMLSEEKTNKSSDIS
ncbi:hypothetical protein [Marinomonas mediterranea]|uniref:Uncharacterized protein n=1 Tax=Marinomonas mediterranea (strain ATCC 700492 / JCM 21426 / NBRC 103028 / MMB-1) TaxID=717774 RepID=F2JW08_MARM1|nr:hypothetical protein [Marinomonas mediterranea]ADZ92896.1 hypothetical protein Marme_3685 [Marinomonas mediterranea MMB-1]WCN18917.1 hypothetical protein GV053_18660 [Marinomonas mediterranea MMB-1]